MPTKYSKEMTANELENTIHDLICAYNADAIQPIKKLTWENSTDPTLHGQITVELGKPIIKYKIQ